LLQQAFAESDMSLCAPFLAFDPVMQFVVGVAIMPVACMLMDWGCEEAKSSYPPYHVTSVMCIAYGAFLLGQGAAGMPLSCCFACLFSLVATSW
jgi:hypothetical protein